MKINLNAIERAVICRALRRQAGYHKTSLSRLERGKGDPHYVELHTNGKRRAEQLIRRIESLGGPARDA